MSVNLSEATSHAQTDRQRIVAIISASFGNLIEWFDFYIYSFCAIYFASAFFPSQDTTSELLRAAGVFAAGFLARPVGGWFFGRLADKCGRRVALVQSGIVMFVGSLIITVLPTYSTIGYAAPGLLLLARLLQGLSVGGDYGTSATYMSEVALKNRRGFFSSFQYATLIGGQLLAVLIIVILQQILSDAQLREWGWRIPFALGAVVALVSIWLRCSLHETTSKKSQQQKGAGSLRQLLQHKQALITVFGITAAGSLSFYTFTTYMQKYLVNSVGMLPKTASLIMTASLFVYMLLQPVFGAVSDRLGRRTLMIMFSALMTLCVLPLLSMLSTSSNPYVAFCLIMAALVILSLYTSIGGLIKAELFPTEVRALGVGFSYAIANAIFGGSAEYVALWLKSAGIESSFYWYVTVMCALSLWVALRMPDLKRHSYLK